MARDATEPVTMRITNPEGVPFTVRIVRKGDAYGKKGRLTHDEDQPMIEFYDDRYPFDQINNHMLGQFVSRYYWETLLKVSEEGRGINLYGGVSDWYVSGENVQEVANWASTRIDWQPSSEEEMGLSP